MSRPTETERAFTTWRNLFPAEEGLAIEDFRRCWDSTFAQMPVAEDANVAECNAKGVRSLLVSIRGEPIERHLLLLHGGGYMCGNPEGVRDLAARLARSARADVLIPDYRLAPEHAYPAAVEDAVNAYGYLLEKGLSGDRVGFVGESAGGGLAIATAMAAREQELRRPAVLCCFSPWVDMTVSGESVRSKASVDPIASGDSLRMSAQAYLQGQAPTLPLASPLYGDLTGLPALLIQVGSEEVLLDDATRLAAKAREAGVDVTLEVADGLPHVFQYFGSFLPEARSAIERAGEFIAKHIV